MRITNTPTPIGRGRELPNLFGAVHHRSLPQRVVELNVHFLFACHRHRTIVGSWIVSLEESHDDRPGLIDNMDLPETSTSACSAKEKDVQPAAVIGALDPVPRHRNQSDEVGVRNNPDGSAQAGNLRGWARPFDRRSAASFQEQQRHGN
jgi:hypothetical protein